VRYLIQVQPDKLSDVQQALGAMDIRSVAIFDYLTVDIPPELVPKIAVIPGVVAVIPERRYAIKYVPVPIDQKLAEFSRRFWSNPLTGPPSAFAYSLRVDTGKRRVPTSESRKMVGADVAETEGITGKGIRIAVLDTGTSYDFLFQGAYLGGRSSMEGQPVPYDEVGHGVHVQTTISGRPFQSIRGLLKGVAVDAEVVAFKCLGGGLGFGTTSSILRAIADAVEFGADVVNMSLGGDDEDYRRSPYHRIISALTKQGMCFVVAMGNAGPEPGTGGSPGTMPDSLTIGAVDIEGKIAPFSSRGPTLNNLIKPDAVCPGVDILSTSSGYIAVMQFLDGPPALAAISGTSMATPHASGVVALALQYAREKGKKLTTDHIKEALDLYGDYAGAKNNTYGWGLISYQILRRYIDERL